MNVHGCIKRIWKQLRLTAAFILVAHSAIAWNPNTSANDPVSTTSGFNFVYDCVTDGAGGFIVTWVGDSGSTSSTTTDIFAQRFSPSGNPIWGYNGVRVTSASESQVFPHMVADSTGGALIAWTDQRSGTKDIYAQRLSPNGNAVWSANGVPVCTSPNVQEYVSVVSDGSGGIIVGWEDKRNNLNGDIYAQRLNSNGSNEWAVNGVAVCTVPGVDHTVRMASDGAGGAILTWNSGGDLLAQRVNDAGTVMWPSSGAAITTVPLFLLSYNIISDGSGGAIVSWEEIPTLPTRKLFAQRIDNSGVPLWGPTGTLLTTSAQTPRLITDQNGGAIIAYETFPANDLYVQRVSGNGDLQWNPNGNFIASATYNLPTLIADQNGGAIIAWSKDQNVQGGGINLFAQRINLSGVSQWSATGATVCNAVGQQYDPVGLSDGNGGAFLCWNDQRSEVHIYASRIDGTGALYGPSCIDNWMRF